MLFGVSVSLFRSTVNQEIRRMNLEFEREVWIGHMYLGMVSLLTIFKALGWMRLLRW